MLCVFACVSLAGIPICSCWTRGWFGLQKTAGWFLISQRPVTTGFCTRVRTWVCCLFWRVQTVGQTLSSPTSPPGFCRLFAYRNVCSGMLAEQFCLSNPPSKKGDRMNPRVAGLVGNQGPQNKQPFMVAFFRATGVRLRSIRSAPGHKQRNQNRPKTPKNTPPSSQEALRMAEAAGSASD